MKSPQRDVDRAQKTERDAMIYTMRLRGMTERQIAAQVGLGPTRVHEILAAAYAARTEPLAEELRAQAADRLDDARRIAYAVRARTHYVIQGGKIVKDDEGLSLIDSGPVLAANAQILKIEERAARLFGLDSPEALMISLDRRTELEAEMVSGAIEAVINRLDLEPERKVYALEAAAAVLDGQDPGPPPETETVPGGPVADGAPWIMEANGVKYVVVHGQRFEWAGTEPVPDPILTVEVIADVEDPDPVEGDLTDRPDDDGPDTPTEDDGPSGRSTAPMAVVLRDDTSGWPLELQDKLSPYRRIIG